MKFDLPGFAWICLDLPGFAWIRFDPALSGLVNNPDQVGFAWIPLDLGLTPPFPVCGSGLYAVCAPH